MKKYLLVIINSWQEYFAYRLNFVFWRVRVIISVLIVYFLWLSIYKSNSYIFGYQISQMLTYIILLTFLNGIILSTQVHRVAEEINNGHLSNFLIRPISYFGYNLARDISDKIINTFFSILEIVFLVIVLKPPIIVQTDILWLFLFFIAIVFASILYFEISMILSFIGFWSKEVWAPRFIFFILVSFLAGTYFPLDIFPAPIYNFLRLLPFTYLIFFPLKIYLANITLQTVLQGFLITVVWLIALYIIVKYLWLRGLKEFAAEGR